MQLYDNVTAMDRGEITPQWPYKLQRQGHCATHKVLGRVSVRLHICSRAHTEVWGCMAGSNAGELKYVC